MLFSRKCVISILFLVSFSMATSSSAAQNTAPVSGFARDFLSNAAIADAKITILETGEIIKTDEKGNYGPINYPIGQPITLVFEKSGYQTTQSATVIVPSTGLTGTYDNITFQVPTIETYYIMAAIIGADIDDNSCHVATTVTAYHKTLDDIPQGEPGATITFAPSVDLVPFYFDIFKRGPLKGKTNPFTKGLTATSEDGGVGLFNLPPSDVPYTISAVKPGVIFSEAQFLCRKGVFINISPPRGPMVQN